MTINTKQIILNEKQQKYYDYIITLIETNHIGEVSIIGAAGTGKTLLANIIIQYLTKNKIYTAVLAPTHQALKVVKHNYTSNFNINYQTLHSFFGLSPIINSETGVREFVKQNETDLYKYRVIIIDESSMISKDLHNEIKELTNKLIIYIGDKYQLKNPKEEYSIYDNINAHLELTDLVRNDDMEVIDFATSIRYMIDNPNIDELYNFLKKERNKDHSKIRFYDNKSTMFNDFIKNHHNSVITTFTNKKVNEYNEYIRSKIIGDADIVIGDKFVIQETGTFENSEILEVISYKLETANINNKEIKYYECKIKDKMETLNIVHPKDRKIFNHMLETLKQPGLWEYHYRLRNLFPDVKYHYAYTIHKLQGSTFDNIYIDMRESTKDPDLLLRLFYIAITRARFNVNIFY